jgi:hypothetical protein
MSRNYVRNYQCVVTFSFKVGRYTRQTISTTVICLIESVR